MAVIREQSRGGCGTHFSCCKAPIARLASLKFVEHLTQPRASLVQLRLQSAYRASQDLGNLTVFISLDIVQDKYCAVAHGQPLDAALEIYSVNRSLQQQVGRSNIDARQAGFIVLDREPVR